MLCELGEKEWELRVLHSIVSSSGLEQSVGSSNVEEHNGAAGVGPPLMLAVRFIDLWVVM